MEGLLHHPARNMDSFLKFAALPLGVVVAVVVYRTSRASGAQASVRGPPPLPVLGNALDMPTQHEWVTFNNWKAIYGRSSYHS